MEEEKTNWREYLLSIIDGKYLYDIGKSGKALAFVKNQIESKKSVALEYDRFTIALDKLINDTSFSKDDALKKVRKYKILIEFGNEFLLKNTYIKKCIYLQSILLDHNTLHTTLESKKGIKELLMLTSKGIVKYIEDYNTKNTIFSSKSFLMKHPQFNFLIYKWESKIINAEIIDNPNIVIGLIYLNFWVGIEENKIKPFFNKNKGNTTLYSAILFDLKRLEPKKKAIYKSFIKSVQEYDQDFYRVLSKDYADLLDCLNMKVDLPKPIIESLVKEATESEILDTIIQTQENTPKNLMLWVRQKLQE